jgi:hypothetical protein
MIRHLTERSSAAILLELSIFSFAVLGLVGAEVMLSAAIHGTNYAGGDGKMAQAIILAAQKFAGFFHFNNINPIEGVGSQLLPLNVWVNPAYWPFAILDKAAATDASAVVALAIFATACYVMARCFDVPMLPSAIAAQLCIVLFAPILFLLDLSTVFSLMVGNAVVYAPHMVALGLLARLEPGSWRSFGLITAGIFGLLFYSICCDPLWSIVNGSSWALPFAIVAFSPMRPKAVFVRCAALGCCAILLVVSGVAEYLYTLVQYTARAQFPALGDRVRGPDLQASALFYSPYIKYFYFVWVLGWLLGLLTLRGRARVLVIAGMVTCGVLLAEILVYLLLLQNASWSLALPVYVEQSLFPLFFMSAVVGYWGALRAAASWARALVVKIMRRDSELSWWWLAKAKGAAAFVVVALVPAAVVDYAINRPAWMADLYNEPWPNEPEFVQFLADNTALAIGQPFRGSNLFSFSDYAIRLTIDNLWVRDIPIVNEYDQLVTPQSVYFNYSVFKNDVRGNLNAFFPQVGPTWEYFLKVLPMLGARYYIVGDHQDPAASYLNSLADRTGYPVVAMPQGAHYNLGPTALWHVYELPHPNVGNYCPTQVMTADTGDAAAEIMIQPDFDFTKQAVLSIALDERLVPALNMQMSPIRGGLRVSGHSDGTSLVVLPQQFSHCLRARDERVRLVRANLMMTGMIFSGDVDTDIVFDYGIFTPRCRWADLSDIKRLKLQIDARAVPLSGDRLFPDWQGAMGKLRAAASAIK